MPDVDLSAWGERAAVTFKAATEIQETGEVCVDTFLELQRLEIAPEAVARAMKRLEEIQEESE